MTQTYRLGELLVKREIISDQQLCDALAHQKVHGTTLGESLQVLGMASALQIRIALFKQHWLRSFAAATSLTLAPFCQCLADNQSIEHLPEYSLTQVAQSPSSYQAFNASDYAYDNSTEFDVMELATTAIWYVAQGGIQSDGLEDIPVKVNLTNKDLEDGMFLNVTVRF